MVGCERKRVDSCIMHLLVPGAGNGTGYSTIAGPKPVLRMEDGSTGERTRRLSKIPQNIHEGIYTPRNVVPATAFPVSSDVISLPEIGARSKSYSLRNKFTEG